MVPVTELIERGRVRMSITCIVWTQGTRKCVPSPVTSGSTPRKRSKTTARSPPSTVERGLFWSRVWRERERGNGTCE